MTKHWFMIVSVLLLRIIFESTRVFGGTVADHDLLCVEIVNYLQSVEYTMTGPQSKPVFVSTRHHTDSPQDTLEKISMSVSAKQNARNNAAKLLGSQFGSNIKWANFSPDKRFVLIGHEDPSLEAMTSATLLRVSDFTVISRVKADGLIHDSQWSPDSSWVAILESTERMSKTPWGLFAALSGHPVELQTFYVRWVALASGNEKRVKVATDIENAIAELRLQPPMR